MLLPSEKVGGGWLHKAPVFSQTYSNQTQIVVFTTTKKSVIYAILKGPGKNTEGTVFWVKSLVNANNNLIFQNYNSYTINECIEVPANVEISVYVGSSQGSLTIQVFEND